jgi:hypothetical protein
MDDKYLVKALKVLTKNAEFTLTNGDYSTIEWHVLEGKAPTQAEVDAAIDKIKADEAQRLIDAENAKAAAQVKLEALGLTADDLKALGL